MATSSRPSLLGLLALALASPAAATLVAGTNMRTLESAGQTRHYMVHVPRSYDGSVAVPLVLDFHGLGSNAAQQAAISGMIGQSDKEGFLVAHPDGLNNAWNAGICCGNRGIDDVAFIRAVVAAIQAEGNVDARRIYATGLSNGGAISQRLACEAADLFAAAAPMAFPLSLNPLSSCQPSRSMPVATFMGLTDVLVRYAGGPFPSAATTFQYWHDVDDCAGTTPDETVVQGASRCESYARCRDGAEVMLCSITAAALTGAAASFSGHILYLNDDFRLAEVAWAFLSRFTLPDPGRPGPVTLDGRGTLKVKGSRPHRGPVEWAVSLDTSHGDGTWSAAADGNVYGGTYAAIGRKDRTIELTPNDGSRAALATALAALTTGGTGALTVDGASRLRGRLAKDGTLTRLTGKLTLRNDGGGRAGAYAIHAAR